ncbi:unnamed protein product [Phyllotreta striolata]|uniref:acid phosphatase n=1 Tax=Phyllotreta striolata TaxID=444603 RepID=A0A9N9TM62_PHYSR|nr:unnamed protein product [Phyllotreta striolata]
MVFKVVLLIFAAAAVNASNDNLIAVVQVFRHGQRTPNNFFSNDPYADLNEYWAGLDYGQLTNEGKRQHYALGQFSRKRYSNWLPATYSSKDIYAQTTDVDRTHMSAQANLYGLYPATGNQVWRKNVNWQPIPLHPANTKTFSVYPQGCPNYNALRQEVDSNEEYTNIDKTYADLYRYISQNTNTPNVTLDDVFTLWDSLLIEDQVGYALPSWTSSLYPEPIRTLAAKWFAKHCYNQALQQISVGLFYNEILGYFDEMIADPTSTAKYRMYSGHDNNVVAILTTVGQKPTAPVPFAVSLWFELRRTNWDHVVNLWMKSGDQMTQLSINGCALDCPLSEVKKLLSDVTVDEEGYQSLCKSTDV